MCLFHTKPQRRLRIYPVPVSCFNDDANTFGLHAIFILQVEPSKLCMPTCHMRVTLVNFYMMRTLEYFGSHLHQWTGVHPQIIDIKKCQTKTPVSLCLLGPLLTKVVGNIPNAQNLGGCQFETCLYCSSRKSSSPGCICRVYVICHISCMHTSYHMYTCIKSKVMKANSPPFQDHLADQHPIISAKSATQNISNT